MSDLIQIIRDKLPTENMTDEECQPITYPCEDIFYHASNIGGLDELFPLSKMHGGGQSV